MLASLSGALIQPRARAAAHGRGGVVDVRRSYAWKGLSTVSVSAWLLYRLRLNAAVDVALREVVGRLHPEVLGDLVQGLGHLDDAADGAVGCRRRSSPR